MHALSEQEMQVDGLEKNAEIDRTSSCGSLWTWVHLLVNNAAYCIFGIFPDSPTDMPAHK